MTKEAIEMAQAIEYERIIRTHERKSKAAIIKEKVAEYVAAGVDRSMAYTMAKVFYEYEI